MVLISGFIFIIGLFIGSFLGVLIDRIPKNKSFIKGRSICDFCKKPLNWYDLLPVVSFILLKGKCRYCKHKLPFFYPAIELLTAVIFTITFLTIFSPLTIINFKFAVYLFYLFAIVSSFVVIFFIDLREGIIPDRILVFDILLVLAWLIVNPLSLIINHLLTAFGSFLFFIAIAYIFYFFTKKDGMGGGDIKLAFILGLFLGFPNIVAALYIAFLTGAFISVILLLWKKKLLKDALPFGPFLITGAIVSLFFGNQLVSFFLKLMGL